MSVGSEDAIAAGDRVADHLDAVGARPRLEETSARPQVDAEQLVDACIRLGLAHHDDLVRARRVEARRELVAFLIARDVEHRGRRTVDAHRVGRGERRPAEPHLERGPGPGEPDRLPPRRVEATDQTDGAVRAARVGGAGRTSAAPRRDATRARGGGGDHGENATSKEGPLHELRSILAWHESRKTRALDGRIDAQPSHPRRPLRGFDLLTSRTLWLYSLLMTQPVGGSMTMACSRSTSDRRPAPRPLVPRVLRYRLPPPLPLAPRRAP